MNTVVRVPGDLYVCEKQRVLVARATRNPMMGALLVDRCGILAASRFDVPAARVVALQDDPCYRLTMPSCPAYVNQVASGSAPRQY